MDFEWNSQKARENQAKHGVTFEEAAELFADELASKAPDPDHSVDEHSS